MAEDIFSIPEMLRYRSKEGGTHEAFSFYDRHGFITTLTSTDTYTLAGKFAFLLKEWGFQAGDVIANGLPNSPERVITDFGIIMAGCVLTSCQVIEKDGSDFWHTAKISACRGVILSSKLEDPAYQLFSTHISDTEKDTIAFDVRTAQAPTIQTVILCHRTSPNRDIGLLEKLRKQNEQETFEADCAPSDLAVLISTSGSTGFTKLVPSTHEKVLKDSRTSRPKMPVTQFNDRPFGWLGGFPYEALSYDTKRILQDMFNGQHTQTPGGLWDIISSSKCMGAVFLPDAIYEMIDHFQPNPPEFKLWYIGTGGQPLRKDLMNALGLLCKVVVISYGCTEGGAITKGIIYDSTNFEDYYCGTVEPDVQIKIVDGDGNELSHGEDGEIYLKSDRLVYNYYNQDESITIDTSRTSTQDGWYKTGDRGVVRDDGSLYCYGRSGEVVSVGSILIYLSWLEAILKKCPSIQTSNVVGIETDQGGAKFCACVVLKNDMPLTEIEVIDFFDGQMADTEFKTKMRLSRVFFFDNLPLLPTGKLNKRWLKQFVLDKMSTT